MNGQLVWYTIEHTAELKLIDTVFDIHPFTRYDVRSNPEIDTIRISTATKGAKVGRAEIPIFHKPIRPPYVWRRRERNYKPIPSGTLNFHGKLRLLVCCLTHIQLVQQLSQETHLDDWRERWQLSQRLRDTFHYPIADWSYCSPSFLGHVVTSSLHAVAL